MSRAYGSITLIDLTDKAIDEIVNYYASNNDSSKCPTSNWKTSVAATTALSSTNRYLWTYQSIKYTDSNEWFGDSTGAYVVAVYGDTGVGIKSVVPLYAATNTASFAKPSSAVTQTGTDKYNTWSKSVPVYNAIYPNYFTCSEVLYDNNTRIWTDSVSAGAIGEANKIANEANDKIDNLQIGGRNQLLNTATNIPLSKYSGTTWTTATKQAVAEWNCNDAFKFDGTGGTSTVFATYTLVNYANIIADEQYVASIYVKNTSSNDLIVVENVTRQSITLKQNEAKRCVFNVTKSDVLRNMQFIFQTSVAGLGFCFYAWHPQVEFGNKVTDWTPALEDVDNAINNAKAINVILTNEHQSLAANSSGTISSYTGASTQIQVFYGSENVTANSTFKVSATSGVTGSLSGNTYTVTALSSDNGYVDLQATYNGLSTVSRFSLSKSKAGTNGSAGASAKLVDISCTNQVFKKNKGSTTYSPTTITLTPTFQNCSMGKWYYYTGSAWTEITATATSTTAAYKSGNSLIVPSGYTYNSSASSVTFKCEDSTKGYYDTMTVVRVTDGTDGTNGTNGTTITSITEEYYKSTSKTTQSGGSWTTTPPTWENGYYIWTRSKIVYANPTKTEYTTPICDSSWEAVNDIQIGGRNLFLSTRELDATKWDASTSLGVQIYTDGNINYHKIYSSSTSSWIRYIGQTIQTEIDDEFTISFLARKNTDTDIRIGVRFDNNNEVKMLFDGNITSKEWQRYKSNKICITKKSMLNPVRFYVYANSDCISESTAIDIALVKLEKGNKATDWTPAPEDTNTLIARSIEYTNETKSRLEGNITELTERTTVTEGNISNISTKVSSLEQRADEINMNFGTLQETVDKNSASTEEQFSEIRTNIQFSSDGITIGKNTSKIVLKMINDEIGFYSTGGDKLGYFNNSEFHIYNGVVDNSFRVGNFAFIPRENGSVDFKKIN